MLYPHIVSAFFGSPWAILPAKLAALQLFLARKCSGEDVPPDEVAAAVAERRVYPVPGADVSAGPRPPGVLMAGRVAVLPVMGVISQRVGGLEQASGGVGADAIGAALDGLVQDRSVRCIVMAFDSPGGSVHGVGELADKIRMARDQKKVVGLADSVAASAAYWLLSQCSEVNVTPGGQVGSIGVLAAHQDLSAKMDAEGVKTTVVSAGKYKAEANPFAPLSEEALAELQAKVDHYYGQFVQAVAKGRGVSEAAVKSRMGEGRMVTASDAVARGMADRVATLEQVLRRCGGEYGAPAGPGAAARARAVAVECGLDGVPIRPLPGRGGAAERAAAGHGEEGE